MVMRARSFASSAPSGTKHGFDRCEASTCVERASFVDGYGSSFGY
jgi:hypothetical protein